MKPVSLKLLSAEVASEDVFTHRLKQLRETWSALTSYTCYRFLHIKHKTIKNENRL